MIHNCPLLLILHGGAEAKGSFEVCKETTTTSIIVLFNIDSNFNISRIFQFTIEKKLLV